MGKLYTNYAFQGEKILATFENGTVYSPSLSFGMGHQVLMYYDGSRIYRSVTSPFLDGLPNVLARCDKFGRIESENGTRLGYCENGEVKDSSGSIIAYYDGDMFGAAAAACAMLFHLSDENNVSTSDTNGVYSENSKETKAADSSTNANDSSIVSVIFTVLGAILLGVWKFIKTLPFWGPYVIPIFLTVFGVLFLTPQLSDSTNSASSGIADGSAALFFIAYLILHTVILFKRKKWESKYKYWPIYVEFILFVFTFVSMWGVPAVAFQIGVLIHTKWKSQSSSTLLCQNCGKQIEINEDHCSSCGKLSKNEQGIKNASDPISERPKEPKVLKKIPLFVILPVTTTLLLCIFNIIQSNSYKSFVNGYFSAVETDDMNEITQFYSWDYAEAKNKKNKNNPAAQFFIYDDLEDYINSRDKYYRWFSGEEVERIEITEVDKNSLFSTPQIKVEVYVVFEERSNDVVVYIDMERGKDGWYIIRTDAYYASEEKEN